MAGYYKFSIAFVSSLVKRSESCRFDSGPPRQQTDQDVRYVSREASNETSMLRGQLGSQPKGAASVWNELAYDSTDNKPCLTRIPPLRRDMPLDTKNPGSLDQIHQRL